MWTILFWLAVKHYMQSYSGQHVTLDLFNMILGVGHSALQY